MPSGKRAGGWSHYQADSRPKRPATLNRPSTASLQSAHSLSSNPRASSSNGTTTSNGVVPASSQAIPGTQALDIEVLDNGPDVEELPIEFYAILSKQKSSHSQKIWAC